jgi:hypothetical protein
MAAADDYFFAHILVWQGNIIRQQSWARRLLDFLPFRLLLIPQSHYTAPYSLFSHLAARAAASYRPVTTARGVIKNSACISLKTRHTPYTYIYKTGTYARVITTAWRFSVGDFWGAYLWSWLLPAAQQDMCVLTTKKVKKWTRQGLLKLCSCCFEV